jgi:TrwC relaxase
VKSVSTLWALAKPAAAAQIESAHRAAIGDALAFIERHALFCRTGANGVRQVNVQDQSIDSTSVPVSRRRILAVSATVGVRSVRSVS